MEFFIWYAIIGVIVSTLVTYCQLIRLPWAEVSPIGFFMSVIVWPFYLAAFIIAIIRDGW